MKIPKIGFLKLVFITGGLLFMFFTVHRLVSVPSYTEGLETSQFQTEKIRNGSLEIKVSCTGTLAAVGTVEVGTQVSGTIAKVLVDYNDRVTKGQIIAVLDLDPFNAAVDKAKSAVIKSKALFKQAMALSSNPLKRLS